MTDLERLIAFWEDLLEGGRTDFSPNVQNHIIATISALQELKKLKGE